MTSMPTSYETSQTTTTTTSSSTAGGDIRFRPEYIRTIPGILKIVEVVLAIITFICASVWAPFEHIGGPWVQFVSMAAFITTLIIFFFYLFGVVYKFPAFWVLIEFIYYCTFSVMFLIAGIVCAAKGSYHSSIGAAAFFAFAATAVYAVDTFFQFRAWRSGETEFTTSTRTTTTTTTHTSATVESKEAY